jgi:CheY-like chemotaxis protein
MPENNFEFFALQIKDALEHLYDHAHLQNHPLMDQFHLVAEQGPESAGLRLRRELISAIETFNPGEGVPFIAQHARIYNVLVMHYVERVTIQEIAYQLSLSSRQVQRNLRQGEKNIVAFLWEKIKGESSSKIGQAASFQTEIEHLGSHPHKVHLQQLFNRAAASVEPLAHKKSVSIQGNFDDPPLWMTADPVIASQALVSILSRVVFLSRSSVILVECFPGESSLALQFIYSPQDVSAEKNLPGKTVYQLIEPLNWDISVIVKPEGLCQWNLHIPLESSTILIIDDNQGLINLLERYLGKTSLKILSAPDGKTGLEIAKELVPDAIIVDVMMPEVSGWEVLQWLQNDPQTGKIPVIVCSVVNEPDLAHALGAAGFLSKPVRQEDVLSMLNKLGIIS